MTDDLTKYAPYPDDQALAGPDMPPMKSVLNLIRYCTTVHNRFGDTCVEIGRLTWGGSALTLRGERHAEIERLTAENMALRSAFGSLRDRLTEVSLQAEDAVIAINMDSVDDKQK